MRRRIAGLVFFLNCLAYAVIIDQIAVIVGNAIIKDSDIERSIRVTSFLNDEPPRLTAASRKEAANRLIDQIFIRREIRQGAYPVATLQEAEAEIERLKRQKYTTEAAYERALRADGITDLDLRAHFQWQLTVLRFIDLRFRPAVFVTESDIEAYYRTHAAALRREHSGHSSLEDVNTEIQDILTGERVNQEFFSWLDEQRKDAKIRFFEEDLR